VPLRRAATLLVCGALVLTAPPARAELAGTPFSGPTDGDGASLWWNPAAMSTTTASLLQLTGAATFISADHKRRGVDPFTGRPYPNAHLFVVRPEPVLALTIDKLWPRRLRLGVLVHAPSVEGAAWPEYVDDGGQRVLAPTRYHATQSQVFHLYTQVGASLLLHRTIALGVSLNLVASVVDSQQHLDLGNQSPVREMIPCASGAFGCEHPMWSAPGGARGNTFSAGATVGVLLRPVPRLRIGIAYASPHKLEMPVTVSIDTAQVEAWAQQFVPQLQPLGVNGTGRLRMLLPQRVHAAIAVAIVPRVELSAGLVWIDQSEAAAYLVSITQKGSTLLPDTITTALVKNDKWSSWLRVQGLVRQRWLLALHVEYTPPAIDDAFVSPSNADFHLVGLSGAFRVQLPRRVGLGLSYTQTIAASRDVRDSIYANDAPKPFALPDASGSYRAHVERIGATVDYGF
jgi:long-subunit fatty acid transport protein